MLVVNSLPVRRNSLFRPVITVDTNRIAHSILLSIARRNEQFRPQSSPLLDPPKMSPKKTKWIVDCFFCYKPIPSSSSSSNKKMNPMKKTTMAGGDRISSLPEFIIHEILSFLDMKHVVQTSILSPKWRTLWKSTPDLNFDRSFWFQNPSASNTSNSYKAYRKDKAMDFVDRVLLLRNFTNIRKFRLSNFQNCSDLNRVITWLIQASRLCVKHIDLEINLCDPYIFRPVLFTSQVIEIIRLHGYSMQLTKQIILSPKLKVLELVFVQFPQYDQNHEFELSCSVLECLILRDCNVLQLDVLTISAPKLRTLVIVNENSSVCSCVLKICSPSLVSLELRGAFYKDYRFEKLFCLVSCLVEGVGNGWSLHTKSLMKVLSRVSSVKTLEIRGYCRKVERFYNPGVITRAIGPCNNPMRLNAAMQHTEYGKCLHEIMRQQEMPLQGQKSSSQPEDMFDNLLSPFMQLRCLKLNGLVGGSCTQAVSNLLKNAPCIESLFWKASRASYIININEEDQEEISSFEKRFHQLKSISAQDFKGTKVELKFLEVLLKNAIVLEKITILFSKELSYYGFGSISPLDQKIKREELMMKVQSLPKARTSARMAFLDHRGNPTMENSSRLIALRLESA